MPSKIASVLLNPNVQPIFSFLIGSLPLGLSENIYRRPLHYILSNTPGNSIGTAKA